MTDERQAQTKTEAEVLRGLRDACKSYRESLVEWMSTNRTFQQALDHFDFLTTEELAAADMAVNSHADLVAAAEAALAAMKRMKRGEWIKEPEFTDATSMLESALAKEKGKT